MSEPTSNRERFRNAYRADTPPPWDVDAAQPAFVQVADLVKGKVIDAGCGTGENALFFASRGCEVTGIDFLERPIKKAISKAEERGLTATFQQEDALNLENWTETFDVAIDCGLFHSLGEAERKKYLSGLWHVLKPNGLFVMLCFSDAEPEGNGPQRISESMLHAAFWYYWQIQAIDPTRFLVREELPAGYFSEGGPHAWRVVVRRRTL